MYSQTEKVWIPALPILAVRLEASYLSFLYLSLLLCKKLWRGVYFLGRKKLAASGESNVRYVGLRYMLNVWKSHCRIKNRTADQSGETSWGWEWRRCIAQLFSHVWLFAAQWTVVIPGSSIPGIFQARTLEWVAIFYSRASSWPRNWAHVFYISCIGRRFFTTSATQEAWNVPGWGQLTGLCFSPALCC